jgi:hypothetical protein
VSRVSPPRHRAGCGFPGGDSGQGERALGEFALHSTWSEPGQVERAGVQRARGVKQGVDLVRGGVEAARIPRRRLGQREPASGQHTHRGGGRPGRLVRGIGSSTASRAARPRSMPSASRPRCTAVELMQTSRYTPTERSPAVRAACSPLVKYRWDRPCLPVSGASRPRPGR